VSLAVSPLVVSSEGAKPSLENTHHEKKKDDEQHYLGRRRNERTTACSTHEFLLEAEQNEHGDHNRCVFIVYITSPFVF
jgi:hypothetical protein